MEKICLNQHGSSGPGSKGSVGPRSHHGGESVSFRAGTGDMQVRHK